MYYCIVTYKGRSVKVAFHYDDMDYRRMCETFIDEMTKGHTRSGMEFRFL